MADTTKQEPVAYVTGYYGGRCVIEPLNRASVLPTNMALYTSPVDAKAIRAEALEEAEEIAKTIGGSFAVEFLAAIRSLK